MTRKVTVITVNLNDKLGLTKTIQSVLDQDLVGFEYIVIDGNSTDGSLNAILDNKNQIDHWVSEKDDGIYDAMNKGIYAASGDWLIFMNAGDQFINSSSLRLAFENVEKNADVIFSDWFYTNSKKLISAKKDNLKVIHQAVIYRKDLHQKYGLYLNHPYLTIADYIFFSSISKKNWVYQPNPISQCDAGGVSSKSFHYHQKLAVDFLFKRQSRLSLIMFLILHPIYRLLKKFYEKIIKFR